MMCLIHHRLKGEVLGWLVGFNRCEEHLGNFRGGSTAGRTQRFWTTMDRSVAHHHAYPEMDLLDQHPRLTPGRNPSFCCYSISSVRFGGNQGHDGNLASAINDLTIAYSLTRRFAGD